MKTLLFFYKCFIKKSNVSESVLGTTISSTKYLATKIPNESVNHVIFLKNMLNFYKIVKDYHILKPTRINVYI